jgi:hypothetical protein
MCARKPPSNRNPQACPKARLIRNRQRPKLGLRGQDRRQPRRPTLCHVLRLPKARTPMCARRRQSRKILNGSKARSRNSRPGSNSARSSQKRQSQEPSLPGLRNPLPTREGSPASKRAGQESSRVPVLLDARTGIFSWIAASDPDVARRFSVNWKVRCRFAFFSSASSRIS